VFKFSRVARTFLIQYDWTDLKYAVIRPDKTYIEVKFNLRGVEDEIHEILAALLLELGYEGFQNEEGSLIAFIPESAFAESGLKKLPVLKDKVINYDYRIVEAKNWNLEWEKNFLPVVLANRCLVRAPFHRVAERYPLEIVIEPKMAFGTGHHPTTAMIAGYLLNRSVEGLHIFDMGCGSGILGIIASKSGASRVEMADNDPNAISSARENVSKNRAGKTSVYLGGVEILRKKRPDMIIANISLSVLLEQMGDYAGALTEGGILVISGILDSDHDTIVKSAVSCGFAPANKQCSQDWLMLEFCKK
jgi:ribosomal protein L11 methyltransferase